jgi:V/A-type H+-transporting ATPase subunit I
MRVIFALAETSDPIGRIIIIVIGTMIVIGLEGLIVAIQTLRLEYYEFFGKFFSGGGIPFKPFKLSEETCPH